MVKPVTLMDATFDAEVLRADTPVLVDFWADWCVPCRIIAPMVEELSQEYAGKVKFAKLDVDANPVTTARYGIRSIPSLLIFQGGRPVDQVVGAVPKAVLRRRVEASLSAVPAKEAAI